MSGIVRSITHWTAGGGRASDVDKKHYHRITEHDGTIVDGKKEIEDNIVTSDGAYAAHTLNLNTGSAGFSMAGMRGAKDTDDLNWAGPSPINERQFEAHCKMLAEFHLSYGVEVNGRTCLTHAEVQPTLGVKQKGKWDFTRLPFKPELRGAIPVGNYMRERVRSYMPTLLPISKNRPTLRQGDKGMFVEDLQELVAGVGIFSGKIDGQFGPRTEQAVLAFQSHSGIVADGVVGPRTWEALMRAQPMQERDVTEADLRKSGSRTIKAADSAETAGKASAAAVVGLGSLDAVMDLVDRLGEADSSLQAAQQAMLANWHILIVIGIGLTGYSWGPRIMQQIRAIRTDDAQSGANLKR